MNKNKKLLSQLNWNCLGSKYEVVKISDFIDVLNPTDIAVRENTYFLEQEKNELSKDFDYLIISKKNANRLDLYKSLIINKNYKEFLYLIINSGLTVEVFYKNKCFAIKMNVETFDKQQIFNLENCFQISEIQSKNQTAESKTISFAEAFEVITAGTILGVPTIPIITEGCQGLIDLFSFITLERNVNNAFNVSRRRYLPEVKNDSGFYTNFQEQTLLCSKCGNKISLEEAFLIPAKCNVCSTNIEMNNIYYVNANEASILKKMQIEDKYDEIIYPNVYLNKKGKLAISKSNHKSGFTINDGEVIGNETSRCNFQFKTLQKLIHFLNLVECQDIKGLSETLKDLKNKDLIEKFLRFNDNEIENIKYTLKDFKLFVNFLNLTDARSSVFRMFNKRRFNTNHQNSKELRLDDLMLGCEDEFTLGLKMFLLEEILYSNLTLTEACNQIKGLNVNSKGVCSVINKENFVFSMLELHETLNNDNLYFYFQINEEKNIGDWLLENNPLLFLLTNNTKYSYINTKDYSKEKIFAISQLLKNDEDKAMLNLFPPKLNLEQVQLIVKNVSKYNGRSFLCILDSISYQSQTNNLNEFIDLLLNKQETISFNGFDLTLKEIKKIKGVFLHHIFFHDNNFSNANIQASYKNYILNLKEDMKYIFNNMSWNSVILSENYEYAFKTNLDLELIIRNAYFLQLTPRFIHDLLKSYAETYDLVPNRIFNYDKLQVEHDFYTQLALANKDSDENFSDIYHINEEVEIDNVKYHIISPKNTLDLIVEGTALKHCVGNYSDIIAKRKECVLFLRKNKTASFYTFSVNKEGKIVEMSGKENTPAEKSIYDGIQEWINNNNEILLEIKKFYGK